MIHDAWLRLTCDYCAHLNRAGLGHRHSADVEVFRCWACKTIAWLDPEQDPGDRNQVTPDENYTTGLSLEEL